MSVARGSPALAQGAIGVPELPDVRRGSGEHVREADDGDSGRADRSESEVWRSKSHYAAV